MQKIEITTKMSDQGWIYFDGVCGLCNGFVRFLKKRDRQHKFLFAPLSSLPMDSELMQIPEETVIYLRNGQIYTRSDAAIRALSDLAWPWRLVQVFRLIPRGLRDRLYAYVSKNRYKWFGKIEEKEESNSAGPSCSLDMDE